MFGYRKDYARYDIFMFENIITKTLPEESIANILTLIGKSARIQILMVIREEDACVCHLEAALGLRQASISQHLMVMRKAGLVTTRRDGRNIFYRLARPEVVELLESASSITGSDWRRLAALSIRPIRGCGCPQCNPEMDPKLTCGSKIQKNH